MSTRRQEDHVPAMFPGLLRLFREGEAPPEPMVIGERREGSAGASPSRFNA
jgi:hypothetical protein